MKEAKTHPAAEIAISTRRPLPKHSLLSKNQRKHLRPNNGLAIQACAVDPKRSVRWVRVHVEVYGLHFGNARDVVDDHFYGLRATVRIGYGQHVGACGYVIQYWLRTSEIIWTSPGEFIREGTSCDNHVD